MPAWLELHRLGRRALRGAVVAVAVGSIGCDGVVAIDHTPLKETVGPNTLRKTSCRGWISIREARTEIQNAREKGKKEENRAPFNPELRYEAAAVDALIDHINQLSCEFPDITHPDIQKNTLKPCGEEITVGELRNGLQIVITRGEPKSLEKGIFDYRAKYCPQEIVTPTPKAA